MTFAEEIMKVFREEYEKSPPGKFGDGFVLLVEGEPWEERVRELARRTKRRGAKVTLEYRLRVD